MKALWLVSFRPIGKSKSNDFCIGVQWHPEFLIDKNDITILKSLIKSSKRTIEK